MSKKVHAEQLLSNPLFEEIKNSMEQRLFEEWMASDSVEIRESLFNKAHALRGFVESVQEYLMRITDE